MASKKTKPGPTKGQRPRIAGLSPSDRSEMARFRQWMVVEDARKKGADPDACNLLQTLIYLDPTQEGGGLAQAPMNRTPSASTA